MQFSKKIGEKEKRRLKGVRKSDESKWVGLRMFGMVGWSVVVPALLGTVLGIWLDKNHPVSFSWTLTLLLSGIILGCLAAWYWIERERDVNHTNHNSHEE